MQDYPRVGIGVCVRRDNKVLMQLRKDCPGDGMWGFPGGHLEMYEDPVTCAIRETKEETDLNIENPQYIGFTNTYQRENGAHYVTLFFSADVALVEPRNMEPHKCEELRWCAWSDLPSPLFWATRKFIDTGYNPFTS